VRKVAVLLFALTLAVPVIVAKDKTAAARSEKISGWVSSEKCGVKDIGNADCVKKCAEAGQKLVIVSDKGHTVYNVDNQESLKGHEGRHVRVTGSDNNGTLHVDNVDMLKNEGGSSTKKK
jgi:hypothetical protein